MSEPGLFDNVLLAFDDVDEFICLEFCRDAPATLAPRSAWEKLQDARQREKDAEAEDFFRQQEAEIAAEHAYPQWMVW